MDLLNKTLATIYKIIQLILATILVHSCTGDLNDCMQTTTEHTLIFYMGGDNNLSDETYQKINAIQKWVASNLEFAWDEYRFQILIYQDPVSSSGEPSKLWRVRYGQAKAELLRTYAIENSASAEVLARVLRECLTISPSKHYGLWLFSHASGWLPKKTLTSPYGKSIIADGREEMDIKDFARAIPDNIFDYIIFEACFMAGIEVAYELKDKTDYIMASSAEMLSPGMTDIYADILPNVMKNDLITAAQIYYEHWNSQSMMNRAATISIISTSALDNLARVVRGIRQNNIVAPINDIQHFDRYVGYRLFFDLEDYFSRMATTPQVQELKQAIECVVLYQASTPTFLLGDGGFKIDRHCGLTTYIIQDIFPFLNYEYNKLQWNRAIN